MIRPAIRKLAVLGGKDIMPNPEKSIEVNSIDKNTLDALSSKASWHKTVGKISEVLAVMVFTCLLGVFWLPSGKLVPGAVIVLMAVSLVLVAAEFSFRGQKASLELAAAIEQTASLKSHVISDTRIETLKEAKVPADVIWFLRSLLPTEVKPSNKAESNGNHTNSPPPRTFTTSDLVFRLTQDLGPERTNEVKDAVLKYTEESIERIPPR
jgi:hypothetical protein